MKRAKKPAKRKIHRRKSLKSGIISRLKKPKGVTQLLAVLLLIIVTIILVALFFSGIMGIELTAARFAGNASTQSGKSSIKIESVNNANIYLRNLGNSVIPNSSFSLYINNTPTPFNMSGTLDPGRINGMDIPPLSPGYYTVKVTASHKATDIVDVMITTLYVPSLILTGNVFDGVTMMPISGASVRIEEYTLAQTISNGTGYFSIDKVPPGIYNITASAPGYESYSVVFQIGTETANTLNFYLFGPSGWLEGYVYNRTGSVISEALVNVTDQNSYDYTSETGYYMISGAHPTQHSIVTSAPGYDTNMNNSVFVSSYAGTTHNIILDRSPGGIRGYVLNSTGRISSALVNVTNAPGSPTDSTDTNGYYEIPSVVPGIYTVKASKSSHADNVSTASVSSGQWSDTNITLDAADGCVYGYIRNSSGQNISGANVTVGSPGLPSKITDANGFYNISNIRPGLYGINATKTNFASNISSVVVNPDQCTYKVMTITGLLGRVEGYVFNASNMMGISNANVSIPGGKWNTTNSAGYYLIHNLTPGNYSLNANASSFINQTKTITIYGGSTNYTNFSLSNMPGNVSGYITNRTGGGIANVVVTLTNATGTPYATTDSNGYYRINSVVPGNYTIRASLTGYYDRSTSVNIASASTASLSLAMEFSSYVYGKITNATGGNIQGASVSVLGIPGASATTNSNGDYTITDITPGSRTVTASATGYIDGSATITVNTALGAQANMILGTMGWIYGYVRDASNNPISGAIVFLENQEFKYRAPLTISNSVSALSNFQVKATINTQTPISSGKMQADCDDIRFKDANGNDLNYWIESGCNSASTVIWIKVPSVPAGSSTIYMVYGNPSATGISNGFQVFDFFDDFTTTTFDTNKWTVSGSVTSSGGIATINNNGNLYTKSSMGLTKPFRVEARYQHPSFYRNRLYLTTSAGGGSPTGYDYGIFSASIYWNGWTGTTLTANTWYIVRWDDTTTNYVWSIYTTAGSLVITRNRGSTITGTNFMTFTATESASSIYRLDWIRARKYASAEPTVSTGSEGPYKGYVTSGDGYYYIGQVMPGSYTLTASASTYLNSTQTPNVASGSGTLVNFNLATNPGWLYGYVRNRLGTGLSGATVSVGGASNATDSSGYYKVYSNSFGTLTATATVAGYNSNSHSVSISSGAGTSSDFTMAATGYIDGYVSNRLGTGVSGATVNFGSVGSTTTAASGYYRINDVPAGTYLGTVTATGYNSNTQSVTVGTGQATRDFSLTATGYIDGYVRNRLGTALPGSAVNFGALGSVTTDSNGYYRINDVPVATYSGTATATGYNSNTQSVTTGTGQTSRTFTMVATSYIWGYVRRASDSTIITGATVSVSGVSGATATSDASGRYQINDIPAGSYTVTASVSGYATDSQPASVSTGAATERNFALVQYGWITGRVTNRLGGISGATVAATGAGSATTDSSGYYTIYNVPAGTFTVTASASGYTSSSKSATVSFGAGTTTDFSLTATSYINGYVTNRLGTRLSGATVNFGALGSRTTDANGYYRIDDVPPATYSGTATATGYNSLTQSITVTAGAAATRSFTMVATSYIWGYVRRASDSVAISGASVSVSGISGATATSDASGRYQINDIPAGSYTVTASVSGYNSNSQSVSVSLGSGAQRDFYLTCNSVGLGTPTVSPASPTSGSSFQILCPASLTALDCMRAYANNYASQCTFSYWSGTTAIFNCAGMAPGTYTARCDAVTGTSSACCAATQTSTYTVPTTTTTLWCPTLVLSPSSGPASYTVTATVSNSACKVCTSGCSGSNCAGTLVRTGSGSFTASSTPGSYMYYSCPGTGSASISVTTTSTTTTSSTTTTTVAACSYYITNVQVSNILNRNYAFVIRCYTNWYPIGCVKAYSKDWSAECTFVGWQGTGYAQFNCPATGTAGTFTARCVTNTGTADNCCYSTMTVQYTMT